MNAVVASAVFPPEPVVSAQLAQDLASELVRTGHTVDVCCPQPSRPLGADYSAFKSRAQVATMEHGISVARLPSYTSAKSRFITRARESLSFGRHASRFLGEMNPKPNVIYVNAWPLFAPALIIREARRLSIPTVLQIQDVYPESMLLKLPTACRGAVGLSLRALDAYAARRAKLTVTISESMRRTYIESRRIPEERVLMIPNWQNESRFASLPERSHGCGKYGLNPDLFTFLFLGNIGPVAGVDMLIRAFTASKTLRAQLVVAGGGSAKAAAQQLVKELGTSNVTFITDPDVGNVPLIQSLAHVCVLPMRRGAGDSSIPSKLLSYMFSAKPVLATVDPASDTARTISEAKCGWVGAPEDIEDMSARMCQARSMPVSELERLGQNGRRYGLEHFSKSVCLPRLSAAILAAAVSGKRS